MNKIMGAQKKQKAGRTKYPDFSALLAVGTNALFYLECENHNMRSSIYMHGQNKSNLYFVESLVETESEDTG